MQGTNWNLWTAYFMEKNTGHGSECKYLLPCRLQLNSELAFSYSQIGVIGKWFGEREEESTVAFQILVTAQLSCNQNACTCDCKAHSHRLDTCGLCYSVTLLSPMDSFFHAVSLRSWDSFPRSIAGYQQSQDLKTGSMFSDRTLTGQWGTPQAPAQQPVLGSGEHQAGFGVKKLNSSELIRTSFQFRWFSRC